MFCNLRNRILNEHVCWSITFLNKDKYDALERNVTTDASIRNNKCLAPLLRIKTECAPKKFHATGAELQENLPTDVRTAENENYFQEK